MVGLSKRFGVVAAVVLLTVATASAWDWPTFRGDSARTGSNSEVAPPPFEANSDNWTVSLGVPMVSSPTVGGGRVYVGARDNKLYCLDTEGTWIWTYTCGGPVDSSAAYFEGRVYFGSSDGYLRCVRAASGDLIWESFHGGDQLSSPLVSGGSVFIACGDPSWQVRAYRASDGRFLWAYNTGQVSYSSFALYNGRLYCAAGNGTVFSLNPSDGSLVWQQSTSEGSTGVFVPAVADGRVVFFPGGCDRKAYMYDPVTGGLLVKFQPPQCNAVAKPGLGKPADSRVEGAPVISESLLQEIAELGLTGDDAIAYIESIEQSSGETLTAEKDYFRGGGGSGKPDGGGPVLSSKGVIEVGSPAIGNNKVFLTERELGLGNDEYHLFAIDPSVYTQVNDAAGILVGNTEITVDSTAGFPAAGSIYIDGDAIDYTGITATSFTGCANIGAAHADNSYVVLPTVWSYFASYSLPEPMDFAPSPVVSGDYVMVAWGKNLHIFEDTTPPRVLPFLELDAEVHSSLAISDGAVYVATYAGTIYRFNGANTPPEPPGIFDPPDNASLTERPANIAWTAASDRPGLPKSLQDPPELLRYEIEMGYEENLEETASTRDITAAGVTQYPFTLATSGSTRIFYRVRTVDTFGAASPWSAVQDFWVTRDASPPAPPSNFEATPGNASVSLSWTASPSSDVAGYMLCVRISSEPWPSATFIGNVTSYLVDGLVNDTSYDFLLTAYDFGENISDGIYVYNVQPKADIQIIGGGAGFQTIQAAIDAAAGQGGGTVKLGVGTFNESITLRRGVSLRGEGPHLTVINGNDAPVVITVEGTAGIDPRSAIEMLTVTGGGAGVNSPAADLRIANVIIARLRGTGVLSGAGSVLGMLNVTIADNGGNAIETAATSTTVGDSIICNNVGYGIVCTAENMTATYNDVYGNGSGNYSGCAAGIGSIAQEISFLDWANLDYREPMGSANVDAGDPASPYGAEPFFNGGCANMGAFGNTQWATKSPYFAGPGGGSEGGGGGGGGGGGCFVGTVAGR